MIIAKANAKENLGEFICLSITKANAKTNLQICNHFCVDGTCNYREALRILDEVFQKSFKNPCLATRAACYRIEKRGNPENGWGGCWEECCENSGCWRECWRGCCSSFLSKESPPRSTLASTPASTPNFRSTLPSTLPSHFLDFPVSLFCSRPPGSQPLPLKPAILVKKSVVLVKSKNGFTKTIPWAENPRKIRRRAF